MNNSSNIKKLSNCKRVALVSDVHGNLPALQAVFADARGRGAEHFLLLGDYVTDFPYPNEIAELLQNLENTTLIRGNKEERYAWLHATNDASLSCAQMSATRWNLEVLTDANREFLCTLPDDATLEVVGANIYATHSVREICRPLAKLDVMHSSWYTRAMDRAPFSHAEYLEIVRQEIAASEEISAQLAELPTGVYAFGHNHLQGHWQIDNVLLVNPGSCGLTMNFDARAPYTILDFSGAEVAVEEYRVEYDVDEVVAFAKQSQMYKYAPEWCEIHAKILRTGRDYIGAFLEYAYDLSARRSAAVEKNSRTPKGVVADGIWREAWETWDVRKSW